MVLALLFLAGHMVWAPRFSDRDPRHLLQRTYFFESEKGKFFAELYSFESFKIWCRFLLDNFKMETWPVIIFLKGTR
jgi:hypothetical protein